MLKKVMVLALISVLMMQGAAFAFDGDTLLEDSMYGGAIGGVLGIAWYLLDDDDLEKKLGTSVGLGILAGFLLGVSENVHVVEVENGNVKLAMPQINVVPVENGTLYQAGLVQVKF